VITQRCDSFRWTQGDIDEVPQNQLSYP
jgi:hypothetical protein